MSLEQLVIWIVVGGIAGILADAFVSGIRVDLVGAILVGILGAFVGGWLLGELGIRIGGGVLTDIVTAFIGAAVLLLLLRVLKRL